MLSSIVRALYYALHVVLGNVTVVDELARHVTDMLTTMKSLTIRNTYRCKTFTVNILTNKLACVFVAENVLYGRAPSCNVFTKTFLQTSFECPTQPGHSISHCTTF